MTEVYNTAEGLISAVKGEISGIRFIKAYSGRKAEIPVSGYLAVVSVEEIKSKRSGALSGRISALLYGAPELSAEDIGRKAEELYRAFKTVDSDGLISEASVNEARYDNKTGSVCRELALVLSPELPEPGGEITGMTAYINGARLRGLRSVSVKRNSKSSDIREILSGEIIYPGGAFSEYEISIKTTGELAVGFGESFSLALTVAGDSLSLTGCTLISSSLETATDGEPVTVLKIKAVESEDDI